MFEGLAAEIAKVRELDTDALTDSEFNNAMAEVHTLLAQLEGAATRMAGRWDARRCWDTDRARTGAAWLAWKCRVEHNQARRRVGLGRALRNLPVAEQAWLDGEITATHVGVLSRARNDRTAELMARDEAMLVDKARTLKFRSFVRAVAYWLLHADPDGCDDRAQRRYEQRQCHVSESLDELVYGSFQLDPLGGAAFKSVLKSIEDELFKAEWAEAEAQWGDDTTVAHLPRSFPQRRADALVEMARRAAATPAGGRKPAPLFTVLVGYETFKGRVCELANGKVVTPGSLVRWLDEALIERVVFDGPARVINVGHQRLFTGALRRAIEVRDRTCFHVTCDDTEDLQVDHIWRFVDGGPTDQINGRLGCGFHNRDRERDRNRNRNRNARRNRRPGPYRPENGPRRRKRIRKIKRNP